MTLASRCFVLCAGVLGSCDSTDEKTDEKRPYVATPEVYPYTVALPNLVPVGSKLALAGVEVGSVGADRIVKIGVPESVRLVGGKPGRLTFRVLTPCGIRDIPLAVIDRDKHREGSRYNRRPVEINMFVDTSLPEQHYVYVDRDGSPAAKVSIGAMVLEPPKEAPATGERHLLFNVACPDGRIVKIDDKPIGELPEQLLGNSDMDGGPAYYLVSSAKRCYTTTKHVYGELAGGPSTTDLRKGQVHRLPGDIDDWLKRSPKKTTVETGAMNALARAIRRDLVRTRC
jgi:hypothetical protein